MFILEEKIFFLERLIFALLDSSAKTNSVRAFISSMAMIFIFGFANFYLLDFLLEHFENGRCFLD